jgi:phospholipid/cholesterol/gamma-HCH transport system substrate-binding protein
MRRLAAIGLVLATGVAAALAIGAGGGDQGYRVDAVFDNAASLVPGNVVKIAGAPVGTVKDIRLTPSRRARVEMEIQSGFAPFRSDARCVIAPESLFIGEKYVQCKPGTPSGSPLGGRDGRPPTVPLGRNSSTVDLDLVLSTLRLPVRQRLSILFTELGAGLAGRPRELSAAVHRANPALQATNKVLRILDQDRSTLGRLVDRSDQVIAELAARRKNVQGFITRAGEVTNATAARRDQLQEAVRRLPPLLDQLKPSAERLGALARQATPALADLQSAAPAVQTLLRDVRPLSDAGTPALAALGHTARKGRHAVRPARPVVRRLRSASRHLPKAVSLLTGLARSLQSSGAIEGLQSFIYYTALSTSRFDRISHMVPAYVVFGDCSTYAEAPVSGCDAHFGGAAAGAASRPRARRRSRTPRAALPRRRSRLRRAGTPAEPRAPAAPAPAAPQRNAPPADLPSNGATGLLDWLLGP